MAEPRVKAPAYSLSAMEPASILEFNAFVLGSPLLLLTRFGDGHPVLVLPGFTGSDRSTLPLRTTLRSRGYWVHGWRLGRNVGPRRRVVEGLKRRLDDVFRRHGRRVSLIGWSLGGVYARELARLQPDAVRQVITLGSPFRLRPRDRSRASALYDALTPAPETFLATRPPEHERPPIEVPVTSIYTRTDGVVRWHSCIEAAGSHRENIEVRGTHSGLGYNLAATYAVLDRLARPEGDWQRFRAPLPFRSLYPSPAHWQRTTPTAESPAAKPCAGWS